MARTEPFEKMHRRYEAWFDRHRSSYLAELEAVELVFPKGERSVEIGVGTGRFAAPLGIWFGIDPSLGMLRYAARRGIRCIGGVAEAIPIRDGSFDACLVVTTICFVDDPQAMLAEAYRILRPGGAIVVGFVDKSSRFGADYLKRQASSEFYRFATFYAAGKVASMLDQAGFTTQRWVQTLLRPLDQIHDVEPVLSGVGEGGFAVALARKAAVA